MSKNNKPILTSYDLGEAGEALEARGFIARTENGDGAFQLWEHPPYQEGEKPVQVRIRSSGELDVNSRGRLEKTLKEADRRHAEEVAKANAPTHARRPDGLPAEYDALQAGDTITLADTRPPYFSLSFARDSDAATLGNAAVLTQISGPIKEMLAEAERKFHLQLAENDGTVRIVQPDLGIESPPLARKSPAYIQDFTTALTEAEQLAEKAKKASDDFGIAFHTGEEAVIIAQPDLGIDQEVKRGGPGYHQRFQDALSEAEKTARKEMERRLEVLLKLDGVTINGEPLKYELTQAGNLKAALRASSGLELKQDMQVHYYADSVIPQQVVETLEKKIKLQALRSKHEARRREQSLPDSFTSKLGGQTPGSSLPDF